MLTNNCNQLGLGRRDLLKGVLLASAIAPQTMRSAFAQSGAKLFAYVGCRTTKERNARGEGIGVYRIDSATGEWQQMQLLRNIVNPSYLAFDRKGRNLYAVHGDFGEASAYSIDPQSGEIALLNQQDCGGKNPVHLIPDLSNRFMLVANYATGTLGALPINSDGSLGPLATKVEIPGQPGPHKTQQKGIQPHQIQYDPTGRFLVVPDKGGDKVAIFRFDPENPAFIPNEVPFVKGREGAGCRHITFHPSKQRAYLANELDCTVTTYAWDAEKGALTPLQIVPTIPQEFVHDNTAAGIATSADGRFLYVSNRGHDSIAVFIIDEGNGLLKPDSWVSTQGKQPRFFAIDPSANHIYAANENSGTIAGLSIDRQTGRLTPTGQVIRTGSPTCIVFRQT
jgi:6-phosphogluconolactonase